MTLGEFLGQSKYDVNPKNISLLLYLNLENFEIKDKTYMKYDQDSHSITGYEKDIESFYIKINSDKNNNVKHSSFQKYRKKYEDTWRLKKWISEDLKQSENLNNKNKLVEKTESSQGGESWKFAKFESINTITQANIIVELNCIKINIYVKWRS